MPDLSERQALLLRRMGVDIWKLRSPSQSAVDTGSVEAPAPASQEIATGLVAAVSPRPLPQVPQELTEKISLPDGVDSTEPAYEQAQAGKSPEDSAIDIMKVESSTQSRQILGSPEKSRQVPQSAAVESSPAADLSGIEPAEKLGTIVNWRTLVEYQPDTDWLFVCATESDLTAAEKKLFEAILFALKLDPRTCSKIWACPVRDVEAQQALQHGTDDAHNYISDTLKTQLSKEQPDNIVLFGEQLAQFVIGTDKSIDQLRSEDYRYQGGSSRLVVTYDLGHLLENPLDKAKVWGDLQKARAPK